MKKIIFLIPLVLMGLVCFAQDDITICHTTTTDKFAMFASNKDFNAAHSAPRNYVHISAEDGKMITYKCADSKDANAYLHTSNKKTDNWIIVIQERWGLNDNIKRQAEDSFKDLGNVNVLAIDMYDGKLATDRETASKYMQEFKQERGDMIIKGALDYMGKKAKVGTVGWCFGGGQSLIAALAAGNQTAACVIYYGMPVEDVDRLKKLNSDVLMIWPTKDQWINKEMMDKFQANMKSAGKNLTIKPYDADHAFANP